MSGKKSKIPPQKPTSNICLQSAVEYELKSFDRLKMGIIWGLVDMKFINQLAKHKNLLFNSEKNYVMYIGGSITRFSCYKLKLWYFPIRHDSKVNILSDLNFLGNKQDIGYQNKVNKVFFLDIQSLCLIFEIRKLFWISNKWVHELISYLFWIEFPQSDFNFMLCVFWSVGSKQPNDFYSIGGGLIARKPCIMLHDFFKSFLEFRSQCCHIY